MDNTELQEAIKVFSKRFHRNAQVSAKNKNYISSPLGAWMLLAQLAGGNSLMLNVEELDRIENCLGMPLPAAFDYTNELLRNVPAAIKAAGAAWIRETYQLDSAGVEWVVNTRHQESTVVNQHMATKGELDEWAKENTLGIIEKFPFEPDDETLFILANALATKISWRTPFEMADGSLIHSWDKKSVLHSKFWDHSKRFVRDSKGELYGVLVNTGDNIFVTAVIAENPDVSPERVLEVAEALARNDEDSITTELASGLPAEGNIFKIEDRESLNGDKYEAFIPAWSADSTHALSDMGLPFLEASHAISSNGDLVVDALQIAKARYHRVGFEAAAITSMRAGALNSMMKQSPAKFVSLNFNHPFAVAASHRAPSLFGDDTWRDLPVFTAWIVEAEEATEEG